MGELTLYHYWRSSCSWRVRWALDYKEIAYGAVAVDLLKGEQRSDGYLARNPGGAVPCLEVGGETLAESLAILEWLEESYPHRPLLPKDRMERAWVRQFCLGIVAGIQPLQNLTVLQYVSPDEAKRKAWARHWISRGLLASEKRIAEKGGLFSVGDELSWADLCLVPQMYNAHRFELRAEDFPRCEQVYRHCLTLPSCQSSAPERFQPAK